MGIGPFGRRGGRARHGGVALGVAAAALVAGGGASPLVLAIGKQPQVTAVGRTATGMERRGTAQPRAKIAEHAATTAPRRDRSPTTLVAKVVAAAADGRGGYWEAASNGGLFAAGSASYFGSLSIRSTRARVVGVAGDPATRGYWEVTAGGGVFGFGAPSYGSMGGRHLRAPIVGMASTPDGRGYWEVAADGRIFRFGDARYYGSMGGRLRAPIVGMASTPDGRGYWEVAKDGGVFAFHAPFYGSLGGRRVRSPIAGFAVTPKGRGYWEVAADGAVYRFGHARFEGEAKLSVAASPTRARRATATHSTTHAPTSTRPTNGPSTTAAPAPSTSSSPAITRPIAAEPSATKPSAPRASAARPAATKPSVAKPSAPRASTTKPSAKDAPATAPAQPATNPAPPASPPVKKAPAAPPPNPPADIAPVPVYTFQAGVRYSSSSSLPCWQMGSSAWVPSAGPSCLAAEIAATDNARASEGLGPIRLPTGYASLTPEEQLFVITDIERVSRGEAPVVGLSPLLDGYAQAGAAAGNDPQFSFSAIPSSNWWGSNVVSDALNALDANYTWMYDDGYGGYNVDCTSPASSGCWGHRDNELTSGYGGTLVMGAGDVQQTSGLQSMSELLVAVQDPSSLPPLSYTWAQAVAAGAAG